MKDILSEIKTAEEEQAGKLMTSPGFASWVETTRNKYIVGEFIRYFYAYQGRFSRGDRRVRKLGNYILPTSRTGELFDEENNDRVHNEEFWFWLYLTTGYDALRHKPAHDETENPLPAEPPYRRIWQDLHGILVEHNLHGEGGGGIHELPVNSDILELASIEGQLYGQEPESKAAAKSLRPFDKPRWMTLFTRFEWLLQQSPPQIEVIPPWFHILRYLFFNIPIRTLPVFFASYDQDGSLDRLSFISASLTDAAKALLATLAGHLPIAFKSLTTSTVERRTRRNMRWWLWHVIGNARYRRRISYNQIAVLEHRVSRSTIQSGIQSFQRMVEHNLDGRLFKELLQTAREIGLDATAVYDYLGKDDFDFIE
jgi:hypothetical protein